MNRVFHLFHELFIRNFRLKLLSLLLAFLLWLGINKEPNEPQDTRWLKVPLVVRNLPDANKYELVSPPVYTIDVQFKGLSSVVRRLSSDEANAVLNLQNFQPRITHYTITNEDIHIPTSFAGKVEIQDIIPNRITMEFDETMTRQVPIDIRTIGQNELARGFVVGKIECLPYAVTIKGPSQAIEHAKVYTDTLDLKNAASSFKKTVRLFSDSPRVRFDSTGTTVSVQILPAPKK